MIFFMLVFLTLVVCYLFIVAVLALFWISIHQIVFHEQKSWYADEIQKAERIRQEIEQVQSWKRFQTESSDAIEKG